MAKEMIIEKSVHIKASTAVLYNHLKHSLNQEQFSVWNMADPNKQTTTKGTDGSIGFEYSWDSKVGNVGAGKMKTILLKENSEVGFEVEFYRPMKNTSKSTFTLQSNADQSSIVYWEFRGPTKFPMSLFAPIFKNMLGKDIQKSLDLLKKNIEEKK
jgi:hypothetical protein